MSTKTTNYEFIMPALTDSPPDITATNPNWEKIDTELKTHDDQIAESVNLISNMDAKIARGTATALTITLENVTTYRAGMKVTVIAASNNGGAATTLKVNALAALPVYKPNTTTAPTIKVGKPYTFILSSDLTYFFIEASAEGDAVAANVLAGRIFSNDDDTGLIGAMTDRGAVTITPGTANQAIQAGYHNGNGYVVGDPDLISANIKAGVNIFGVAGNSNVVDTSAGDATAAQVLSGKKVYVDGVLVTGTMANKVGSNTIITPSASEQAIPAGYYGGALTDGKVLGLTLTPGENLTAGIDGRTTSDTSGNYVKVVTANIRGSGTIRVRFDLRCAYAEGYTAYGRIYKNGVATGIERAVVNSATWVTFTEDIAVSDGDSVQLYIRASLSGNYYAYSQNYRIYVGVLYPMITT